MPSSYDIEVLIGGIAVLAVYGYAAFWAFNIRKGLTVKLYRNQALGIGLVGISLAYFTYAFDSLANFVIPLPTTTASTETVASGISFALILFAVLPLFYWTDQSLQAARQSDPLERDQFHWNRVRFFLWIAILFTLVIGLFGTYTEVTSSSGLIFIIVIISVLIEWGIPLASSAILLPFAWRRSYDLTFRRHLKWFALAAISLGLSFVWFLLSSPPSNEYVSSGIQFSFLLISGYFLYRSARAVVPLYAFKGQIRAK